MGMMMGRSLHINHSNWTIAAPLDAHIPLNQESIIPRPRASYDMPTTFTHRLIEYQLCKTVDKVDNIRTSPAGGSMSMSTLSEFHHEVLQIIESLPPLYHVINPDTTWDETCPWLVRQREYLCCIFYLCIMILHRPYIFPQSQKQPRTEVLHAGINILHSQAREFAILQPHHYKLFTLVYFALEGATCALAVIITSPGENRNLFSEAFEVIRESIQRLIIVSSVNPIARKTADLIQGLLLRAENASSQYEEKNLAEPSLSASIIRPNVGLTQVDVSPATFASSSEPKEYSSIDCSGYVDPSAQNLASFNGGFDASSADNWNPANLDWWNFAPDNAMGSAQENWNSGGVMDLREMETIHYSGPS
jgi:hypothetical protein